MVVWNSMLPKLLSSFWMLRSIRFVSSGNSVDSNFQRRRVLSFRGFGQAYTSISNVFQNILKNFTPLFGYLKIYILYLHCISYVVH